MKRPPLNPKTFVVYVVFPSGGREYAYLCTDTDVRQGSHVIANGVSVPVIRTAQHDPIATKFVYADRKSRSREIAERLSILELQEEKLSRWSKLKSPEAKRLVRELKELSK